MTDDSFNHLIRGAASDEYRELNAEGIDEMADRLFRRRCSTPTPSKICNGKWQAAILAAEQNRPKPRDVSDA